MAMALMAVRRHGGFAGEAPAGGACRQTGEGGSPAGTAAPAGGWRHHAGARAGCLIQRRGLPRAGPISWRGGRNQLRRTPTTFWYSPPKKVSLVHSNSAVCGTIVAISSASSELAKGSR